ncbi:hypothetical protein [Amycolatopsis pigmentata]|uniref:Uncharacterized protein n=1 Tax=Amycolatopsis pigmentata TaxID=450801 RepID=A0ABW5FSK2_9PSEU
MTRLDVATGRGTARTRRWLTRALFVAGGAIAGTAAAWAISTASASATTELSCSHLTGAASDVVRPGSDDRGGGERRAVADDVRDTVGAVADRELAHPAPNAASPLDLLTDPPRQTPRVIDNALRPAPALVELLRPASGPLLQVPALPSLEPRPGTDTGVTPSGARTPLAAPEGQVGSVRSAPTAVEPQENQGDRIIARTGHHTAGHSLRGPAPLTPPHAPPAPPALPLPGGSATNAHVDGPVFGVPAPASVFPAADGPQGVRFGLRRMPVEPGTQPGVTPD